MTDKQVQKWADVAMWEAPKDPMAEQGLQVEPQVTLLHMTARPLQVMAAVSELYQGRVVRSPADVPEGIANHWFRENQKTKLQAPFEFVDLTFLFEGVTRAFTHQLVRQRTAVYVQESLRFAVKSNAEWEVALPPSIARLKEDDPRRILWDKAVYTSSALYNNLINNGVPAEDARGLLPTNITTRVHYKTNLRNLAEHAGLRLCSQAQHEWKQVWKGIINAILTYDDGVTPPWQRKEIGKLFKPVCYATGKCEFMSETDRWCAIRSRVQAHHAAGEAPDTWQDIDPREPLMEGAARMAPEVQ